MKAEVYQNLFEVEQKHWWYVARREILNEIIRYFNLPSNASLLELGSGTGGNLEMLSQWGKLDAIEMSQQAITLTHERFNNRFRIWQGYLPDHLPSINKTYDLICMLDVLEHIKHDRESLVKIHSLLKKDGRILITVPAYSWLWSIQDTIHQHYRRYSKKLLKNTIPLDLYHIDRISFYNTLLFPMALIARTKDKIFKSKKPTGEDTPTDFINNTLKSIFSFEKNLVNKVLLPFGLSLYLVIRKK